MNVLTICILISSLSFFAYALSYFRTSYMKEEFQRFGLKNIGLTIVILEILGALGLLVGFLSQTILLISSLGLALLMMAGVIVRIKVKDKPQLILPAFFFLLLNAYIFWRSIQAEV